ncbi:MAG: hypothetical protein EXS48_00685 [Candidatus Staskawiczbacteria bacterium]|nr:hypothetical protein [Candidatus Staskawiczbacteria bacterium]
MVKHMLALVLACLVTMGFAGVCPAQDVDDISRTVGKVTDKLEETALKLKLLRLQLQVTDLSIQLDTIELCRAEINLLAHGPVEKLRESIEKFLSRAGSSPIDSVWPKVYGQEVRPILVASFKGDPLPKKLTKTQARIVLAGGEKSDLKKMSEEALLVIGEEDVRIKKKGVAVVELEDSIKKELEKIKKRLKDD